MKQRQVKEIDEKYEKKSLMDEYFLFLKTHENINKKVVFHNLPYLGIFYLPVEISSRIKFFGGYKECEKGNMKKCKVIDNSSSHHLNFVYFDDYNDYLQVCEIYKDDYYLEGNVLKERYSL